MRLSVKSAYGILAALDLALQNGEAPVQARAIARRQAIPLRFLEQVLASMKKAGLVESLRGAKGGYLLRKSPSTISLAEIVEALDGPLLHSSARGPYAGEGNGRRLSVPESLLTQVWERVRQAELAVLSGITLKELSDRHQTLQQQRSPMYHI